MRIFQEADQARLIFLDPHLAQGRRGLNADKPCRMCQVLAYGREVARVGALPEQRQAASQYIFVERVAREEWADQWQRPMTPDGGEEPEQPRRNDRRGVQCRFPERACDELITGSLQKGEDFEG